MCSVHIHYGYDLKILFDCKSKYKTQVLSLGGLIVSNINNRSQTYPVLHSSTMESTTITLSHVTTFSCAAPRADLGEDQ